jgi:branched-subunit amino acid transport protein AzlD
MNTQSVSLQMAIIYTIIMAAVIFFCRFAPFIFFADNGKEQSPAKKKFLAFIERTAPPVAMAVLAVHEIATPVRNAVAAAVKTGRLDGQFWIAVLPVIAASAVCAALYVASKRNALVSIFGSTVLFMVLERVL